MLSGYYYSNERIVLNYLIKLLSINNRKSNHIQLRNIYFCNFVCVLTKNSLIILMHLRICMVYITLMVLAEMKKLSAKVHKTQLKALSDELH